jgi:hypothetical protein
MFGDVFGKIWGLLIIYHCLVEQKSLKVLTARGIFAIVVMTTDIIIIILASDGKNVNNKIKY